MRNKKALWVFSAFLAGVTLALVYVLKTKGVTTWEFLELVTFQGLKPLEIFITIFFGFVLSLNVLPRLFPKLRLFFRPLQGFGKYDKAIDESATRYPRLVWILLWIIFLAMVFMWALAR